MKRGPDWDAIAAVLERSKLLRVSAIADLLRLTPKGWPAAPPLAEIAAEIAVRFRARELLANGFTNKEAAILEAASQLGCSGPAHIRKGHRWRAWAKRWGVTVTPVTTDTVLTIKKPRHAA